jgi:chromate reductase
MTTYKVGYFIGGFFSNSISRILSEALIRLAPKDLEFSEISIRDVPLYSPDYENNVLPTGNRLERCASAASHAAALAGLALNLVLLWSRPRR